MVKNPCILDVCKDTSHNAEVRMVLFYIVMNQSIEKMEKLNKDVVNSSYVQQLPIDAEQQEGLMLLSTS